MWAKSVFNMINSFESSDIYCSITIYEAQFPSRSFANDIQHLFPNLQLVELGGCVCVCVRVCVCGGGGFDFKEHYSDWRFRKDFKAYEL
jgi:hypothetical protein